MKNRIAFGKTTILLVALILGLMATGRPSQLTAADWPHWRGPTRNDIVGESSGWTGKNWPAGDSLWSTNVGFGSTSPIVAGGKLYTLGWYDDRDHLTCRDAVTGKQLWQQSYACPKYGRHSTGDKGIYSGVTSTPSLDLETGWLYTLSTDGDLNCWDTTREGEKKWGTNLYDRYQVPRRPDVAQRNRKTLRDYGYTSSPLVSGKWLLVEVGDDTGNLIAFDKRTGKQAWASECKDEAGHSGGPVPINVEGIPCVAVLTLRNLVVTRIDARHEGRTLAEYKWTTDFANNIPTPAVHENYVIITSAYNHYAMCKLRITESGAEKVWESEQASGVCSPVIHQGHVYWAWKGIHCLDFETGKQKWLGGKVGSQGSCILTTDDRLIVWSNRGDLQLIETATRSPGALKVVAEKGGLFKNDAWPHVTLANGLLYLKDRDGNLQCLPLTASAAALGNSAKTATKPNRPPAKPPLVLKKWPGDDPSLVLAWKPEFGAAKLVGSASQIKPAVRLETRDKASIGKDGIVLSQGAILVRNADDAILDACKKTGELTVEAIILSDRARQKGPARIISFSTDGYSRNFTLGQEGDQLLFRLRTPRTGTNGLNPQTTLTSIATGRPYHVIVSYRDGQLACYVDGKRVAASDRVRGDFSNWSRQHLLLGDEWDGGGTRNWSGKIRCLAVLNRFVEPVEAKRRFELLHQ